MYSSPSSVKDRWEQFHRAIVALGLIILLPVTASADGQPYRVKAGDQLEISVWRESELQREVLVRPDGGFSFPLAGEVSATGKSVGQLQNEITRKLTKFIPEPVVTVSVQEVTSNRIYVIGKVQRPACS